jgi:hypothetical protein
LYRFKFYITNKGAKAATLAFSSTEEFFIENNPSGLMFTGPKSGPSGHSFLVEQDFYHPFNPPYGTVQAAFYEFSISNL